MLKTIILAAGKGTRMKSDLPKVLNKLHNKALIDYVINTAIKADSYSIYIVVGYKKELIEKHISYTYFNQLDKLNFVHQKEQLGTGHAVLSCSNQFQNYTGNVLVLMGDAPLIDHNIINKFIKYHKDNKNVATLLSMKTKTPHGFGRIIRSNDNNFCCVLEQKDINTEIDEKCNEVSCGVIVCKSNDLFSCLKKVKNNNNNKEYYLPDVLKILLSNKQKVGVYCSPDVPEKHSFNTKEQLNQANQANQANDK